MNGFKLAIFIVVTVMMAIPAQPGAQTITVEAENFTVSHDIAYEVIRSASSSSCSGGYWLIGLDYNGEWVQYNLPVGSFGYYQPRLRCMGDIGSPFTLILTVYPPKLGDPQTSTFNFTGTGYST